jgi:hypothetical protein
MDASLINGSSAVQMHCDDLIPLSRGHWSSRIEGIESARITRQFVGRALGGRGDASLAARPGNTFLFVVNRIRTAAV